MSVLSPTTPSSSSPPSNAPGLSPPAHSELGPNAPSTRAQQRSLNVPAVHLDTPKIGVALATRLTVALLEHILFLKSQIPLPIAQLQRIASRTPLDTAGSRRGSKSHAGTNLLNAAKEFGTNLAEAFETLAGAFAQREQVEGTEAPARACVMFILGGSINTPKSRILLVLDGLEVHVSTAVDEREEEQDDAGDEVASEPPASPSPSPSPSSSRSSSPLAAQPKASPPPHCFKPTIGDENDPSTVGPRPRGPLSARTPVASRTPLQPLQPSSNPTLKGIADLAGQDPIAHTQTEVEAIIRSAERLLARELAQACGADDGGLAAELAPTTTQILLRAPRRFAHPAWLPRQRETRALNDVLERFLASSGIDTEQTDDDGDHDDEGTPRRQPRKASGVKTEGVWIGARGTAITSHSLESPMDDDLEENELIWWSWNGSLMGFTDW